MEDWQLQLYRKSLKKKEKIDLLRRHLPADLAGKACLEVGCARGTVSYFLREAGGFWVHTDIDWSNVSSTKALLHRDVLQAPARVLPFRDESFDVVVSLDYLEHVEDDQAAMNELRRVLKPGGRLLLSTPTTGRSFLLNRIKPLIGLTLDKYGHVREGYNLDQLSGRLRDQGYAILDTCTYSRFFTELIEMGINFAFVKILNKGVDGNSQKRDGSITIGSRESFEKYSGPMKIYSVFYPALYAFTRLDRLLSFVQGYALLIDAQKR
jgi:2-polyprenyl-3-methyl-5-hydroxy-6-metoxy-1,4-benzoquinol methylase